MKCYKKLAILCLAGFFCFSGTVMAAPFPNKTNDVVQDADNYTQKKDRTKFTEAIKKFPDTYKVVVVEGTQPEAASPDEYAKLVYDSYNLEDNAMMIILDINTQQLGVYPGKALQEKGAKMEMLHDKITSYYEPFRNQKQYLDGIALFISEVNNEFDRIKEQNAAAAAEAAKGQEEKQAKAADKTKEKSFFLDLPWWLYLIGLVFFALLMTFLYSFVRRRSIFGDLDETEDWKDELVEKIHMIEVEKPMRRATGMTEEWYVNLANRKENLLQVRILDVEMMIIEAEEACDRFRFSLAKELVTECNENLAAIEKELEELKADTTKVVKAKKENKLVLPELGKQVETVERKLTNLRLEYGLSFHELKVALDDVELKRAEVKAALASGDDVKASDKTMQAQQTLNGLAATIEMIPALVVKVTKELPEVLSQFEAGLSGSLGDGLDLDATLRKATELLKQAKEALEDGNINLARTAAGSFEGLLERTYQSAEQSVRTERQAAAAKQEAAAAPSARLIVDDAVALSLESDIAMAGETGKPNVLEYDPQALLDMQALDALHFDQEEQPVRKAVEPADDKHEPLAASGRSTYERTPGAASDKPDWALERKALLKNDAEAQSPVPSEPEAEPIEYELVIPKPFNERFVQEEEEEYEPDHLVIETEDDILDELERISGALVRIRQQIKRSYLPGTPEQLKYHFDQVVSVLGQIKLMMEQPRYSVHEVAVLVNEANELLQETELLTERTITQCQLAEGAIQYTNRYRRQNRLVNDLLTKAEQSFRELAFAEALRLAEEARYTVENTVEEEEEAESRWVLRRKKKGIGS